MVNKTPFWELQNIGTGRVLSSAGLFGGYPGATAYIHNIHGADLIERAASRRGLPGRRRRLREPRADGDRGRARSEYKNDGMTLLSPFANGDLYLSVMKGGAGLGDPLLRPIEAVARDVVRGAPAAALRRVGLRRLATATRFRGAVACERGACRRGTG